MTDPHDTESVERVIAAPPAAIFALLADPSRHQEIDGSGSVHEAKNSSGRVKLGDEFGMAMKRGVPYSTTNTVIEFEEDRRIAWKTCSKNFVGNILGGPIWRYELEPVDAGTRVRETWDLSQVKAEKPLLRLGMVRRDVRKSMDKTLDKLEQRFAS